MDEFFIYLGRLYPQIWAAIINLIGIIIVGLFINKRLIKMTALFNERGLKRIAIYEKVLSDSRQYLKSVQSIVEKYIEVFILNPLKYLHLLDEYNLDTEKNINIGKQIIEERIKKFEDEGIYNSFIYNFEISGKLIYSLYKSLTPEIKDFADELEKKVFISYFNDSPFIDYEMLKQAKELITIMESNQSYAKYLSSYKDPSSNGIEKHEEIEYFQLENFSDAEALLEIEVYLVSKGLYLNSKLLKLKEKCMSYIQDFENKTFS